jgi:aerobic carbon-monoxide dehydrogenase medium subunit
VKVLPAKFDYVRPETLEEALDWLEQRDGEAKVLAGGQSLIPLMKLRFAAPGLLVDVNRITGLSAIEEATDDLRIGALVRHATIVDAELLKDRYPIMATAAPLIADPITRTRGTMAGSLAHADPAGDWGSVMLALRASLVATSAAGERPIPVEDFFTGPFMTTLNSTEILTEIRVPRSPGPSGGTYLKLERKVGDFATVGVAVQVELRNGAIGRAGIALTAVGYRNIKATAAEEALAGAEPSPDVFEEAGRLAAEAAKPSADVRGSAEYKRAIVRTFVIRGLEQAVAMARGSQ